MRTDINTDSVTSSVKDGLAYCGLVPDRIETYMEAADRNTVTYATFKFTFDQTELLSKSQAQVIAEQTKIFADNITSSTLVVNQLDSLVKELECQRLEVTRLQEEVQRLTKFEQHFTVEKALKHNLELK
jgi:hypothetical protein